MLKRIFIQNFALIEHLDIRLEKGLQVITGETGAGKSIILGALRLILGERADLKAIANPENKSIVEAELGISKEYKAFFDENDLDFEESTIIRREILPSGKSRAFINDVPVTLDVLKQLSERLIDIHSQFETSNLFNEEYQFKIIDGLSENKILIEAYKTEFQHYKNLERQLQRLKNQLLEGNKESDYKSFLLSELEELSLDHINLEELQNQVSMAENSEMIAENLGQVFAKLNQEELGILDGLSEVKNKLYKISEVSSYFDEIAKRVETSYLELKDISQTIENEVEKIEVNPEITMVYTTQLNKINALLLKHQVSEINDLITIKNKLSQEQHGFEEIEKNIVDIEEQLADATIRLGELATQLSENRQKYSPVFVEKAETLLQKLGLEKAKIKVELTETPDFNPFGKESIQLLFQANSGYPLKPIQSAISGGERSRVMLSVKKLMAENAELPTL
ncbi:MAG: AAA family ATPase, partial [Cloacibacterium sp.]|nr:AAA family ATPase [Cloacibacterium sp.]